MMTVINLILISVCAGLANAARVAQTARLASEPVTSTPPPIQLPFKGWLDWMSGAAENLNGVVQNAAKQATEVVDDFEKVQKKREERGAKIGADVVDLMEEVKKNDLMQKLGELTSAVQKDPEDAKKKANELVTLLGEKSELVQKGTELIRQYKELEEVDQQGKQEILQELAESAWATKIKEKAIAVKDIVTNPGERSKAIDAYMAELSRTGVGQQVNDLVAQRKQGQEKLERMMELMTKELMDNATKGEWVKKANEIVNAISTDPQAAQAKADELTQEIANAQLVQKAGRVIVQAKAEEAAHQERVAALHQVVANEWENAVNVVSGVREKLENPEERKKLADQFMQKFQEENQNVVERVNKYQADITERANVFNETARDLEKLVQNDSGVQKAREVIEEIGKNPELARQKATELLEELSQQNELLRKATDLVHSYVENERLVDEENNELLEKLTKNELAQEALRIFSSWTS